MKALSDYNFCNSWVLREVNLTPNEDYLVLMDVGELKQGERVRFVGFDDVDNHYGIFVFVDAQDRILEVSGDCAGENHSCVQNVKRALCKP
ncbi:hypothetical protein LQ564_02695 [Massilia sp. G4R7]|uniref:Uncharacterized protein n=1 Tax=Massilia phyllostachyos TaxID=2898585 RepID=A0ABS8Q0E4_9BURK|nr:hypothetical protein [Massilia phyllostachyos]MCD2515217.1 hypothetical protein [Massilia phyllostachyos]